MHFVQADFFDLEFEPQSFDLTCSIGVLEWVAKFRPGEPAEVQAEFLNRIRALLKPGGQLVIGIENRLGLKYLLGAPDDHIGVPNIAIYDAALAARNGRLSPGKAFAASRSPAANSPICWPAAGFRTVTFFAALPDYKLPRLILPLGPAINDHFDRGELVPEHDGQFRPAALVPIGTAIALSLARPAENRPGFVPSFL